MNGFLAAATSPTVPSPHGPITTSAPTSGGHGSVRHPCTVAAAGQGFPHGSASLPTMCHRQVGVAAIAPATSADENFVAATAERQQEQAFTSGRLADVANPLVEAGTRRRP
jgi:hypothetical protein